MFSQASVILPIIGLMASRSLRILVSEVGMVPTGLRNVLMS